MERHLPVVDDPSRFREECDRARSQGRAVALVPTMGALHEGHLTLIDEARRRADFVAVSVFVNPTQFGPGEDFERYPRDLEGDRAKLAARGADLLFAPTREAMYLDGHATWVHVDRLGDGLCGAHRPGHFDGVTTIVEKLLALTGPCVAVFGRKDYQQLQVIRRMTADLFLPAQIVGAPIVREPDGLAMSSRNAYLEPDQRARGLSLSRGLIAAHRLWEDGVRTVGTLRGALLDEVRAACDEFDYAVAADPEELVERPDDAEADGPLLLAVAARFGQTRLIDNTVLGLDPAPGRGETNR